MRITADFETQSESDLKKTGAWAYSEHPSTDTVCLCWAVDDGEIQEWYPKRFWGSDKIPTDLRRAIKEADEIEAHNVAFEISIWQNVMVKQYGWPEIEFHKWRDSMAVAAYYAMPQALDKLAAELGMGRKDPEGARLITKYSKLHLKTAKRDIPPEDHAKFVKYCRQDVALEREVGRILGDLPDQELVIFQHDLAVAHRGLYLDLAGIEDALAIVEMRSGELEERFKELTGLKPTQRERILDWAVDNGFPLSNLKKDDLEELLDGDELPQGIVRDAIRIRLQHAKASTKKLDAMARQRGRDGRARFQIKYHGASTGRNTGTGFQPLNLTRGMEDEPPERLVANIHHRVPRLLDILYGDAMSAVGAASRHWIAAAPGNIIRAGDYVSIEAVLLACVAGEEWKVEAFKNREPIYERMGDEIHGLPYGTVTKKTHPAERQDGKTGELAFGYQGALGAWLKFDSSGRHSDERILEICKIWRGKHPATVGLWTGLEEAAFEAVRVPGSIRGFRDIEFEIVDEWLTMKLLNDKRLWYPRPQIIKVWPPWHRPKTDPECASGDCDCKKISQVSYLAQREGQWRRRTSYGGKWTENCIQAHSREVLKLAELQVQDAGYDVTMSVYDEIVTESPKAFGSLEDFSELMLVEPEWAAGWPIRVDPWEGYRYKK